MQTALKPTTTLLLLKERAGMADLTAKGPKGTLTMKLQYLKLILLANLIK
jgi:hypothetical protein